MAAVYASLVIKGKKTFSEVPTELKEQVKQILIESGHSDLVVE